MFNKNDSHTSHTVISTRDNNSSRDPQQSEKSGSVLKIKRPQNDDTAQFIDLLRLGFEAIISPCFVDPFPPYDSGVKPAFLIIKSYRYQTFACLPPRINNSHAPRGMKGPLQPFSGRSSALVPLKAHHSNSNFALEYLRKRAKCGPAGAAG